MKRKERRSHLHPSREWRRGRMSASDPKRTSLGAGGKREPTPMLRRSYLVGTTGFDPLAEQGASLILVSKSGSEFRVGRCSLPLNSRKATL